MMMMMMMMTTTMLMLMMLLMLLMMTMMMMIKNALIAFVAAEIRGKISVAAFTEAIGKKDTDQWKGRENDASAAVQCLN